MSRERAFVMAALLFAVLAGIEIVAVLAAIAVPATGQYLLTDAEQTDLEKLASCAAFLDGPVARAVLLPGALAAAVAVLSALLAVINPRVLDGLRAWRSRAGFKLAAVLCAAAGWTAASAAVLNTPFRGFAGGGMLPQFLLMTAGTAAFWLVAGELGWAGRFDAPGMPADAEPRRALALGAAAGAALFVHARLIEAAMGKYFVLVSEVLDGSGETSSRGYLLLAGGLVTLLALVLPLLAGFLSALAPARRRDGDLGRRLRAPLGAFLALVAALAGAYVYAGIEYDLDKPDLAAALRLPEHASSDRTVVLFRPSKGHPVTVQPWPLRVTGSGLAANSTIQLSEENLRKVETYLEAHQDGSVFTYTAQDILVKGYHALWDAERGTKWQIRAADSQLIHRMVLLARLRHLPVTRKNRNLLDSLTGPSWRAGGRAALLTARAYRHFGRPAEARRWLARAAAAGVEPPEYDPVEGPMVSAGSVRGRVLVNGRPPRGSRMALFAVLPQKESTEAFTLTDFNISRLMVDAKPLSGDGRFAFESLGAGRYVVALLLDGGEAPADITAGRIALRRPQGTITVDSAGVRDVGVLELSIAPPATDGRKPGRSSRLAGS